MMRRERQLPLQNGLSVHCGVLPQVNRRRAGAAGERPGEKVQDRSERHAKHGRSFRADGLIVQADGSALRVGGTHATGMDMVDGDVPFDPFSVVR